MTRNQKLSTVLLLMVLSYYYLSFGINEVLGSWTYSFVFKPILAIGLSVYLFKLKKIKSEISLKQRPYFILLCGLAGAGFIMTHLLLGTVEGFGKNPYDVSFKGVLLNLWSFYPYYLLLELIRERTLNPVRKVNRKWILVLAVVVYTLMDFTPSNMSDLFQNTIQQNVEFLGSQLIPSVMLNVLLCQVVIMGGWIPALLLKLSYESMYFFFAILPDLEWITKAFVNILFPVFTLYILMDLVEKKEKRTSKRGERQHDNPVVTIGTYLLSIAIVWFSVGVFPVFPTLVLTGSMEPMIKPGDVVIMKRVDPSDVDVGDIIQFRVKDYDVVHRVIAIEGSEYQTKGDNNNTADSDLVNPGLVRGKYMFHIPAVGRLTLYVKSGLGKNQREQVEQNYELGSDESK